MEAKKHDGRYKKLNDPEVSRKICEALRNGATRKAAAGSVRVSAYAFRIWLHKGEALNEQAADAEEKGEVFVFPEGEQVYADFAAAVEQAEDACEADCAAALLKGARGYATGSTRTTSREFYKTTRVKLPDGTFEDRVIMHEGKPLLFTETITSTEEGAAFETKSAVEWLKRRRNKDWGDKQDLTSGGETVKAYIGVDLDKV